MSETQFENDFRPLAEEVIENVKVDGAKTSTNEAEPIIPEAEVYYDPFEDVKSEDDKGTFNPKSSISQNTQNSNNDISSEEKKQGAKLLAETCVIGYCQITSFGFENAAIISEKKLKRLENKGEINLSIPIRESLDSSRTTSVLSVIQKNNQNIKGSFQTDEATKEAAIHLLSLEFEKSGKGLTNMQQLAFLASQDLFKKGYILYEILNQNKEILNNIKEASKHFEEVKNTNSNTQNTTQRPNRSEPEEVSSVNVSENIDKVETDLKDHKNNREETFADITKKAAEREEETMRKKAENKKTRKKREPKSIISIINTKEQ